ncbi:3-dehydroquinate synthase [Legionella nagasakiensis]|uniref:3-dehydroquinate synthase n=1 Tax=Legionella nagasakiensis TaxID=535290 RepID=UPI0010564C2F|nr:3-dehydroquinate synthase [Legionella nagasakiensis]
MAKSDVYRQLRIQLASHDYPIYIGCHCLTDLELLRRHVKSSQVLIVSNETVAPLYLKPLEQAFASMQCDTVLLKDGEAYKNQQSLNKIYDALVQYRHHRDTTLIALGGGVIGDLAGFAAATYHRGVRFLQLPTTLLAQVDASVGGKTAINHPLAKNMIGSFYQPHAVIMDVDALSTLPKRELRSGCAEMIKYGFIAGGEFLQLLCRFLTEGMDSLTMEQWAQLIAGCCQIKARIVEEDERETGRRALLNLGHTFAHALEAYTHYQRWRHGEAVAIGLYCAAVLSYQLGHLDRASVVLLDSLLSKVNLPRRIPKDIDLLTLHCLMFNDKKVSNKCLRFVLMRAPGQCYLDDTVTEDCLRHALISAVEGDIE